MSKVAHRRVLVSQNGTESYRGQSSLSVIFSRSVNVFLGRRDQSTWSSRSVVVVSCYSWSVVLRGWCLYSMVVMHVFTETYGWGKLNRGQCLDKCTGWVEHV